MKIFDTIETLTDLPPAAVALGNFDGVHLGHQALIREMAACARARGLAATVFTFSNHPRDLLPRTKKVKSILPLSEKAALMEQLGVDLLVQIPFTRQIMNLSPADFVADLLVRCCHMQAAFCGFNYRFGFQAQGDPALLREMGQRLQFDVTEMPAYKIKGEVVSSSLIRTLIASGQVERCRTYMGRHYAIGGEVVVGNRLGKKLGFPTSNLVIDPDMVTPPNGVYVTYCNYRGVRYPSVTNVGVKPTIGHYHKNVETHIFHFDKELYGKQIQVEFLKKTRDEVKFDSVETLSAQIVRDCREAEAFHRQLRETEQADG